MYIYTKVCKYYINEPTLPDIHSFLLNNGMVSAPISPDTEESRLGQTLHRILSLDLGNAVDKIGETCTVLVVLTNQYTILGLQSTQGIEILQTPVMHGHGVSGVEQVNQLVLLF